MGEGCSLLRAEGLVRHIIIIQFRDFPVLALSLLSVVCCTIPFFVFYLSSILRYNIAIYIIQLLGDPENLCRGSQILFRIFPPTNE